jgi:hypothetical protein
LSVRHLSLHQVLVSPRTLRWKLLPLTFEITFGSPSGWDKARTTLKRGPGLACWMEELDGRLSQRVDGVGQSREYESLIICIHDPIHAGAVAVERAMQREAVGADDGVI